MTVAMSPISARVPGELDSVTDLLARHQRSPMEQRLFTRVFKLEKSPRLSPGERMLDLILDAGREALAGRQADMVFYGHTLLVQPFGHRDEFVPEVRRRLGLPGVPVYGISHIACTSVLRAADLAYRFLTRPNATDDDAVLVLGGDQGSMASTLRIMPGFAVCGDAAAAFVMRRGEGRYRYLGSAATRDTRFHRNSRMTEQEAKLFGATSSANVAAVVDAALARTGLERSDVDWIMPHMANPMMWRRVSRDLCIPMEKIYLEQLSDQGHVFGVDGLLALAHADRAGRVAPGARCVLVALAQGAFFHATVVEVMADSC